MKQNLKREEPVPVGITHTGDWFYYTGEVEKIADDSWCGSEECVPVTVSLNRGEHSLLLLKEGRMERMEIDAACFPPRCVWTRTEPISWRRKRVSAFRQTGESGVFPFPVLKWAAPSSGPIS